MSSQIRSTALEGYLVVKQAQLYYRAIGQGQPILLLHGGPDFDHRYFLPHMDRFADAFRLIYYDQRGRGQSSGQPQSISLRSELEDVEAVRAHFQLEPAVILGHSWGGLPALEYALRYPSRVSHLILMNTGPASYDDYLLFRQARSANAPQDMETLRAISGRAAYVAGEPEAVAEYYRVHFRAALTRPEYLDRLMQSLSSSFTQQGVLQARIIEKRLMDETWWRNDYNLLPRLARLHIPTLVIHGDSDFIPVACAAHIAQAIPGASLLVLNECGHFAYLECPDQVRQVLSDFLHGPAAAPTSPEP